MSSANKVLAQTTKPKPHYPVLDGLRGVAAITVVWFHIFEAFASSHLDQRINHGYLAVDFFFILSGFVVAYAYDDRWTTISTKEFLTRRIIRLHPMVIMGALIGGILFYFQVSNVWDISKVTLGALFWATLLNALLIPATAGQEVRGLGEMFPLNGPTWSLFFEYIATLLYVFFLRKLKTKFLAAIVVLAALGLTAFAVFGPYGDLCAGYSLKQIEFIAGLLRVIFSFSAGLLLFRIFKPAPLKYSFWICAIILVSLLAIPRIAITKELWYNGLYDAICCIIIFPILLYIAASDQKVNSFTQRICKILGDLSYPLYMVHYPLIYIYYAWVKNNKLSFEQSLPGAIALFIGSIVLAYLCLKLYDIPVRQYLTKKYLNQKK